MVSAHINTLHQRCTRTPNIVPLSRLRPRQTSDYRSILRVRIKVHKSLAQCAALNNPCDVCVTSYDLILLPFTLQDASRAAWHMRRLCQSLRTARSGSSLPVFPCTDATLGVSRKLASSVSTLSMYNIHSSMLHVLYNNYITKQAL